MNSQLLNTYHRTVLKEFSFLKETSTLEDLFAKGLTLPKTGGYLLPVSRLHADDEELFSQITEWHRAGGFSLLPRALGSVAESKTWVCKDVLGVGDRILFIILDRHGKRLGHIGFSNCLNEDFAMEIDNVVIEAANTNLLDEALQVLIRWAQTTVWPE